MDNEFLQKVNLELLQRELEKDIQGISEMLGVSSQTIYKWSREKAKGGCRPTYDSIYQMLVGGASLKSLFDIGSANEKTAPAQQLTDQQIFEAYQRALAALGKKQ